MVDGIAAKQVMDKVVEQTTEKGVESTATQAPDAGDVSRFENAMGENSGQAVQGAGEGAAGPEAPGKAEGPKSLGDTILEGVQKLRDTREEKVGEINKTLEGGGGQNMTFQDAMRLQFDLMQINLQQDLTTKSADKTSQGVQTLFRNQ